MDLGSISVILGPGCRDPLWRPVAESCSPLYDTILGPGGWQAGRMVSGRMAGWLDGWMEGWLDCWMAGWWASQL